MRPEAMKRADRRRDARRVGRHGGRRPGRLACRSLGVASVTLLLAGAARAGWAQAATSAPPRPSPTEIGVVDGIPILEEEWERIANPYFQEVAAKAGRPVGDDEKRLLKQIVFEELIRERLWLADARRRDMKVSEERIDDRMRRSSFFQEGGQTNEAKFQAFKRSSTSNYPEIRAQVERGLLLEDYMRWMERRFGPREAELRALFNDRTSEAAIRYFVLGPEAVTPDLTLTYSEIRSYYDAHRDEYRAPEECRIQYVRFNVAAGATPSDSAREVAVSSALKGARELLDVIRAGTPPETAAKSYGGLHDSGWFKLGEPVRGIGRSEELAEVLRVAKTGSWLGEPVRIGPTVVVARLAERRQERIKPFREVSGQVKRRVETLKRDAIVDSLGRIEVSEHPEHYHVPRIEALVVSRALDSFPPGKTPSRKDVEKAFKRLRKEAGVSDTARVWADSVRAILPDLLRRQARMEKAWRTVKEAAKRLKKGEAGERVADRYEARAQSFARYKGEPPMAPSLLEGSFLDSLYLERPGAVLGPRVLRDSVFVVSVERLDPAFLPPYETVRSAARSAVLEAQRQAKERRVTAYFESRRDEYLTPERWVFDYVHFRKQEPESVRVPADSIADYWTANPNEFTEPARAKARHILIRFRDTEGAAGREAARARALAIRDRLIQGEAFDDVARETSEDPGSAPRGGDLGEITPGAVVKEFGDVAFRVPIGEISDLVESQYGFHIIRVDERVDQRLRPLEECRREIQQVLGTLLADSLARQAARDLTARARDGRQDLASLAETFPYPLVSWSRSDPVGDGEHLGDLGLVPSLGSVMASLGDGQVAPEPIAMPAGYLAVRRIRSVPKERAPYEVVRQRVLADHDAHERRAVADSLDRLLRAAVKRGADVESLLVPLGGLRESKRFNRAGPIPDLVRDPGLARDSTYLARVFGSKPGDALAPQDGATGTLYSVVDTVVVAPASEYRKQRETLLREAVNERVESWTARLRSRAPIQIHRKDLRALIN